MGAPVAIALAARQPQRVGRLVLYGGYADGHQLAADEVRAAMVDLVRAHWGLGSDVLADVFLPDSSAEVRAQFTRLQRGSTSAEVAADLLAHCYELRVAERLGIEERSAEGHVERIRLRLGVTSRAQIAAWWPRRPGRRATGVRYRLR